MKMTITLLSILLGFAGLKAQESLQGLWQTGQNGTTIEIKESDSGIEGVVAYSDQEKVRPGTVLIKGLKKEDKGYRGKLYAIKKDRWVDALFIPKEDELEILVSAGLRRKTIHWKRSK